MNVPEFLVSAVAAAAMAGTIGLASAQTTPVQPSAPTELSTMPNQARPLCQSTTFHRLDQSQHVHQQLHVGHGDQRTAGAIRPQLIQEFVL